LVFIVIMEWLLANFPVDLPSLFNIKQISFAKQKHLQIPIIQRIGVAILKIFPVNFFKIFFMCALSIILADNIQKLVP